MNNFEFYDVIDQEIQGIINENQELEELKSKKEDGKKSFCFLLWFLKNNLHRNTDEVKEYLPFIVDGNDDNSCDVIFFNKECGEDVFYVIQTKWFARGNINKSNDISNTYKACLTDFEMILNHTKEESKTNEKFNKMYRKLKKHVANNGKVRFLLVALCITDSSDRIKEINEYFKSPLVKTEIYDLISIKNTYIDNKYRGYVTSNPLEGLDMINQDVSIHIKPGFLNSGGDTYIFLLGAEEISRIYKLFGHRLFLKNVRNPLNVAVNTVIKQSAQKDPTHFLGYNNGITVITKKVYPFYPENTLIKLNGLQVINGAQTFKSIADAYSTGSSAQKAKMRDNLAIVMKTIAVEDSAVERRIIQYTNTQTPIIPRDYRSNDSIQEKIYEDLLRNTDIIYERKRGEFNDSAKKQAGLNIVSNESMAQCYLAYGMQNPHAAKTEKKQIFDSERGLYETIFTNKIDYRVLYSSYIVYQYVSNQIDSIKISAPESYRLLKDGKHYVTAIMKHTYIDYDPYFNKQYIKASKKKIRKDELLPAILFNLLVQSDDLNKVLLTAYDKAVNFLIDFLQSTGDDANAIYKRADSYGKFLVYYQNREPEETSELKQSQENAK